ncbi:uncharacterized protein LOC132715937 [Ruditapes philippinarum]|uniref:uncharacterized protein LOC132715937 n=1 Tax=Ruditapes philippinarum TaxID=129788 RepID=UPI00295BDDAE|nr:uncharacterized protein LOC132715937 [Ruditapes philippinarum]
MDHTYPRFDPEERLPKIVRDSIEHSYVKSPSKLKQTPTKSKRKRESSTPTGKTPVQVSKRTSLCEDRVARHCPWSIQEKQFLHQYVRCNEQHGTDTMYWTKCAEAMNVKFPVNLRTGRSCKNAFKRLDITEQIPSSSGEIVKSVDQGTQTDIVLPISTR